MIEEIDGTAGPGSGVACVTVVIAPLWAAAVAGRLSVLVLDSDASLVCWAVPSSVSILQVAVVAVLVVPVSWVSQGGFEQTLCTAPA